MADELPNPAEEDKMTAMLLEQQSDLTKVLHAIHDDLVLTWGLSAEIVENRIVLDAPKGPPIKLLHAINESLELPEGYRAEIIGGTLVVSPSPAGRHNVIIARIRRALTSHLPEELEVLENTTLETPDGEQYIPDLAVWPVALVDDIREWAFPSEECRFALEVTSPRREAFDYTKAERLARGDVPVFLLVDQKERKCIMYSDPTPDGYAASHPVRFGDPLDLPFGAKIDTSTF